MEDCAGGVQRLDLHNIGTDFAAAHAGRCGCTHLDSGRVCQLPHRHPGPSRLQRHSAEPAPAGLLD
jgi:hypothetical protein